MHDAAIVRGRQCAHDLAQQSHPFRERQLTLAHDAGAERFAFHRGIVKYGRPPVSPAVSNGTMCGCWSRAASAISRWNRSTETWPAISAGRAFTTTCRPSARSMATNTCDRPPLSSSQIELVDVAEPETKAQTAPPPVARGRPSRSQCTMVRQGSFFGCTNRRAIDLR